VRELVGSVTRVSHERTEAVGLQLTVELDDALPRLFADPGKIKQVLVNIVFNAIKFTPRNGRVILKAWARRESGS
jgi:two-component system cell cycle sensor histidine kinase PleC